MQLLGLIYSLWMLSFSGAATAPGQDYILQVHPSAARFQADLVRQYPSAAFDLIYPKLGLYRLGMPGTARDTEAFLESARADGSIISFRPDQKVQLRREPNDLLWNTQWDMQRIEMPLAWDISTGGITTDGDTIVVAVLDDGYATEHSDLAEAIWYNHAEIPGDQIDNDLNGYVDDHRGLYLQTGSDDHPVAQHGTAVAGILGATGNNNEGVAGVNWNVRIMTISGIDKESDVIEGFAYIRTMRDRYNSSGGNDGAFVVASNLSAGINNAWAEDHQEWCAVYDDLGSVGVLNVAATTNKSENVDTEGDMPSTCPSDYLVMVTNTDINDEKLLFAGSGAEHVDLGAPGTFTRTTDIDNSYFDFESTSAAAPHVTGAIGLMYSAPCPEFMQLVRADPAQAALQAKAIILQSADANASLTGITSSGGRLNVFRALQGVNAFCDGSTGNLAILNAYPNPFRGPVQIEYQTADLSAHLLTVVDAAGREIIREIVLPSPIGQKMHTFDTSQLPAGIYFVSLIKGDTQVTARILVL